MRGAHSGRKPVRREFGLVWGHGHVHMNGRPCSFVRAGAVRLCIVLVRGLSMGLRTPYRTGCTSSGWCVVPGLEAGGRGRGDVRSPAPACVRREVVRRPAAPAGLVSALDHGDVGRSVAMWPSICTPPCRPERAGP